MPHVLFSLYLVVNILAPHMWGREDPLFPAEQVFAVFTMLSILFTRGRNPAPVGFGLHAFFLGFFFIWMALSLFLNSAPSQLFAFTYKTYIAFMIAALSISQPKHLSLVIWTLVLICFITGTNGVLLRQYDYQWIPGSQLGWLSRINWIKQYDEANTFALLLITAVPPIVQYLFKGDSNFRKLILLPVLFWLLWGIFLTESRGAFLSMVVGLGILILFNYSKKVGSGLFVIAVIGLWAVIPARMQEINTNDSSASHRIEFWFQGFALLKDQPVFGVGYAQFAQHVGMDAHNTVVKVFSEGGVIGYFFWAGSVYFLIKSFLRLRGLQLTTPEDFRIARQGYYMAAGSLSIFAASWFIASMHDFWFLWTGMCVAWYGYAARHFKFPPLFQGKDIMGIIGLCIALIIALRIMMAKA